MATVVNNDWYSDAKVSDVLTHRLGNAGRLFQAYSTLLGRCIKEPRETCLETDIYESLMTQAHRFSLWDDGFDAEHGGLDTILEESGHLKKTVNYFLSDCAVSLTSLGSSEPRCLVVSLMTKIADLSFLHKSCTKCSPTRI